MKPARPRARRRLALGRRQSDASGIDGCAASDPGGGAWSVGGTCDLEHLGARPARMSEDATFVESHQEPVDV